MGHCQQALGLDRLPLTNGSPPVTVFQTGRPYLTGRTDQDREQPRGVIDGLGVCSLTMSHSGGGDPWAALW
jgi:hypothetical protein